MELVLLQKLQNHLIKDGLSYLNEVLGEMSSELKVSFKLLKPAEDSWIRVEVSGDDSEIFSELIERRFGLAPLQFEKLKVGNIYRGVVTKSGGVGYGIYVDIGVLSPSPKDALYPLYAARAQLAEGQKRSIKQIAEQHIMYEGFPLEARLTELDVRSGNIEVWLSDRQLDFFLKLGSLPFERVFIFNVLPNQLQEALRLLELRRDVIDVDKLSLTCQLLTCKLGTSAVGVTKKLASKLRQARIFVYAPS